MIKTLFIYADSGRRLRKVDYHVSDPSDSEAVQGMHKRFPPQPHVAFDARGDERTFGHEATQKELAEAFK